MKHSSGKGAEYGIVLSCRKERKSLLNNTDVVLIDEKGMITGKAAGDAVVTLTAPDEKHSALKVRVRDA